MKGTPRTEPSPLQQSPGEDPLRTLVLCRCDWLNAGCDDNRPLSSRVVCLFDGGMEESATETVAENIIVHHIISWGMGVGVGVGWGTFLAIAGFQDSHFFQKPNDNSIEMHFTCDFAPFRIQTLTLSLSCIINEI